MGHRNLRMDPEFFQRLAALSASGESFVLVTVVGVEGSAPRTIGTRMAVREDGSIIGTIGGGRLEERVREEACELLGSAETRRIELRLGPDLGMCCGGVVEVLLEPQEGAFRLFIFGGGHVARPLAEFASRVAFSVAVNDDRPDFATRERFPSAVTVSCDDHRDHVRDLQTTSRDFVVVVTHDHRSDEAILAELVERDLAYLGVIGSRSKVRKFRLRLKAAGVSTEALDRVHAPIGLDIGAETPEEIAVAIVAHLVQVRSGSGSGEPMGLDSAVSHGFHARSTEPTQEIRSAAPGSGS